MKKSGARLKEMEHLLKRICAWKVGHFELTSGLHSDTFIDPGPILQDPVLSLQFAREIAEIFASERINLVVDQESGHPSLATLVAPLLPSVGSVSLAKEDIAEGFLDPKLTGSVSGKRILAVTDVLTTGANAREMIRFIRDLGGYVVAVAALFNRGSIHTVDLGDVPKLHSVLELTLRTYIPSLCPYCQGTEFDDMTIVTPSDHLRRHQSDPAFKAVKEDRAGTTEIPTDIISSNPPSGS